MAKRVLTRDAVVQAVVEAWRQRDRQKDPVAAPRPRWDPACAARPAPAAPAEGETR